MDLSMLLAHHGNDHSLLPNERANLYATMKNAVVKIDVSHLNCRRIISGVIISPKGLILTAGTTFRPNNSTTFTVFTCDKRRLVCSKFEGNDRLRLFLLKPQFVRASNPLDLAYARLADDGPYDGFDIHCISHTEELTYSYACGRISYLNRRVKDIDIEADKIGKDVVIDTDQYLNQAYGLCGTQSSEGAPIFNSQGKIVGVYAFRAFNFDFIFPLDSLKHLTGLIFQYFDAGSSSMVQRDTTSSRDDTKAKGKRKITERNK